MIPDCLIHNVNNQQLIELKDGSKANYFEIIMNVGESELISSFVTAQKNDRLIVFGATDNQNKSTDNLKAMVKSLRLDVKVDEAALMAISISRLQVGEDVNMQLKEFAEAYSIDGLTEIFRTINLNP